MDIYIKHWKNNIYLRNIWNRKLRELEDEIDLQVQLLNIDKSFKTSEEVLRLHDVHGGFMIHRRHALYDAFQVGIMKRRLADKAVRYLREAYDIECKVISPKSAAALKVFSLICNSSKFKNDRSENDRKQKINAIWTTCIVQRMHDSSKECDRQGRFI